MSVVLIAVGAAAFFLFQAVLFVGDVRSGKKANLLVWRNPAVITVVMFIGLCVGVIVALISQDSSSAVSQSNSYPWPLNFEVRTTQEWMRAIIIGYGAMPILKKGNIGALANVRVESTPISSGRPTVAQYVGYWWSMQVR